MRYFATIALAGLLCLIGFALVLDQRDLFGVLAAFGLVIFGLPVLNLTVTYWLGTEPPQIVIEDEPILDR